MTSIEFWFDFASPYSYPAAMRIEALAAANGCAIEWRAFLLGPIFRAQGWTDSPFNLYPAKGRYMWRDLTRSCAALRIPFRKPTAFPRNGLLAARVACAFAGTDWLPAFVRAVYAANFEHDLDIAASATIARCLAACGQDADAVLQRAQAPAAKAGLRAQTEAAAQLGLFGAPSFRVGDELFWGNDRLEAALAWGTARGG